MVFSIPPVSKNYYLSPVILNQAMNPFRNWQVLLIYLGMSMFYVSGISRLYSQEGDLRFRADTVERVLIHLKNIPQGNKAAPGSNGLVKIERRRFSQQSQTLDAMAGFSDIPVGPGYVISGFHQSNSQAFNNASELWGVWDNEEITHDKNEFIFVRNMPFISDVKVSFRQNNIANPSLQENDELSAYVFINNPSLLALRVRVTLMLKNIVTGKISRYDREITLNPSQSRGQAYFTFKAEKAGEYHFAAGVFARQQFNQWTDCWDWSGEPMFFVTTKHRTVKFSGYNWDVKAGFGNPGRNYWTNDTNHVWIDGRERLNLTLSPAENDRWYATEVISRETFGYGTYTFYIDAHPEEFDPHVVAAIFLYRDENNEIDIEFSRWGDKDNYQFGNYVVQPADQPGNQFVFPILTTGSYTTHRIEWSPDQIIFTSWHGHYEEAPEGRIIAQWQYAGEHIPKADGLRLFFNIWLFRGITPKTDKSEIFTIARFDYTPYKP